MTLEDLQPGTRLWCIRSYCGGGLGWYKEGRVYTVKDARYGLVEFTDIVGAFKFEPSAEYPDDWGVAQDFLLSPAQPTETPNANI